MSLSNFLELELLDHVFAPAAYTAPTNIYCKLHTGDPGEDCTGNAATETTRIEDTFGTASSGAIVTDADALWLAVAGAETYSHVSLWDDETAGNPLAYGALVTPRAVLAGDDFTIDAGDLSVAFD